MYTLWCLKGVQQLHKLMRIVCLVFSQIGSEVGKIASTMMQRQIRPPEEVRIVEGDSDSNPLVCLLREAFNVWRSLDESSQRDTCVLLQSDCEVRKDAVDYLRKTYVPGRIVTYLQQNPFLINGIHAMPLDPSGLVLLPPRFFRVTESEYEKLLEFVDTTPGCKATAFGYFVAERKLLAGTLGSTVPYCRPNTRWDMARVEITGDYLSKTE